MNEAAICHHPTKGTAAMNEAAIWRWVAWHLPRPIVMWAAIRLGAHATTGVYSSTVVPELTFIDALGRWK